MRIRISHKIVAIFMCIIIIAFLFVGGILFYLLDDFFLEKHTQELGRAAGKVNEAFTTYFIQYIESDRMDPEMAMQMKRILTVTFQGTIQSIAKMTESHVWIVTGKGQVWLAYPEMPTQVKRNHMDHEGLVQLPDPAQYAHLLESEERKHSRIGDFHGFFTQEGYDFIESTWLSYGERFSLGGASQSNDQEAYLIYMHMPISRMMHTRDTILRYFVMIVIGALILVLFLVLIMSRTIVRPIKRINRLTKAIATGSFSERLLIDSKDEVGELAHSFNQMMIALDKMEDMRTRFVSNVSHELRTPMTTIFGFVEGILDGTIPQEKHSYYLQIVKNEVARLTRLINDLLTLSRFETNAGPMPMSEFDIHEVIERTGIHLQNLLEEKDLELNIRFCSKKLIVYANQDGIEQVIYNLLHNAVKFSHQNGVITLMTTIEKNLAEITIEDYGIGMKNDELERIWDRFYTVDASRSKNDTGIGLGLSIIKNVMDHHNQPIHVDSEPGRGTRFYFTLPLVRIVEEDR